MSLQHSGLRRLARRGEGCYLLVTCEEHSAAAAAAAAAGGRKAEVDTGDEVPTTGRCRSLVTNNYNAAHDK